MLPNAIAISDTTKTNVTVKCLENTLQVVPVVIEVAETAQYMSGTCTCNVTTTIRQGELRLSAYTGTATYSSPVTFVVTSNTSGGVLSVSVENENLATASLKGSTVTVTALNCSLPTQTITVTSAATDLFAETTAHFTLIMEKVTPTLTLSTDTVTLDDTTPFAVVTATTNSAGTITAWADNSMVCDVNVFENNIQVTRSIRGTTTVTVKVNATPVSEEFIQTFTVTATRPAGANLLINGITLEQLKSVIQSGNAPGTILPDDYFDVTFHKEVYFSTGSAATNYARYAIPANCTLMAVCIGVNHNPEYEGTNRVHFAIMKKHLDTSKLLGIYLKKYNESATNVGGWESSNLRAYLNSTFFNALPADLQAVISPCTKYTDNVGNKTDYEDNVTATTDNIFLPALYEIAANNVDSKQNSYEHFKQAPYAYPTWAENPDGKVSYTTQGSGTSNPWTRSPVRDNKALICYMTSSGAATTSASNGQGFIPCFTIA